MLLSAVLLGSVVCRAPCCAVLAAGVSVWARVLAARVVDRLCLSWNSCPVSTGELCVLLAVSVLTELSWCRPIEWQLTHGRSVDLWCRLENSVCCWLYRLCSRGCRVVDQWCVVLTHDTAGLTFTAAASTVVHVGRLAVPTALYQSVTTVRVHCMSKQRKHAGPASRAQPFALLTNARCLQSKSGQSWLSLAECVTYVYDDPPVAVPEFGGGAFTDGMNSIPEPEGVACV